MGGTADDRNMSDANNFVYDSEGNLIEDKSKKMKISYDWRGMPVEFVREADGGDSLKLVMKYDGNGKRISKTILRNISDGEWNLTYVTHYTGIGTEIREYKPWNFTRFTDSEGVEHCISAKPDYAGTASTDCPLPDTVKVVVPLLNGLGRYAMQNAERPNSELNSAYEFYLKDHLGSTRVVYGVGFPDPLGISPNGVFRAAYDYRSFGEQLDLFVFTRKVTENFTGKEKDDEIELNYFGARHLDPMLGMWISVDPKRQHFSPYTYGNNNPIARIDPDGNADLRMAVFYNRDQNGKVLPPNLKQDVDRALSGALNPWYDTYKVKYFGENASAEEITNFINGGDFGAIAMHGEIDADGIFNALDMEGNYIDAYDFKFNVKTLLGACHSEAFIRFEDETGNLVAPKYDENGMTKSFVESINFLINNSDTKNPYRVDFMGGEKD